ncbi:MAG: choice-of-anchor tandem repeat GloVer-containing protein [Pyrinomonadaceae bacterium]
MISSFDPDHGVPTARRFQPGDDLRWSRMIFATAAALLLVISLAGAAVAQSVTVLHNFQVADGRNAGQLMQASDGFLYGTTTLNGPGSNGTIFRLDPLTGNMTILHAFNGTDGSAPQSPLVQAPDGFLYGTTASGGQFQSGTAFKINAAGIFTTLHNFGPRPNPVSPSAPILGRDGLFYGTSNSGGTNNQGTIWTMDRSGQVLVIHTFTGTNGNGPRGLFQASDNLFYGVTQAGGTLGPYSSGVAYKIDTAGNFTLLHTFSAFVGGGDAEGTIPQARFIQGTDGFLYSTTSKGGYSGRGTIFKMDATGNLQFIHHFDDYATTGWGPGELILGQGGIIYGNTTQGGGANLESGYGTIFRMTNDGVVTLLHTFSYYDGSKPNRPMQASDGHIYGGTAEGGESNQRPGVLFRLELDAPVTLGLVTASLHSQEGGYGVTGYAILNGYAPANATITLTSSNPQVVSVPPSVSIQQGGRRADFTVSTNPVTTLTDVVITASFNGVSRNTTLEVRPPGSYCALTLAPNSGNIGASGGTGSFNIETPAHCNWYAGMSSGSTWISIVSSNEGQGPDTLTYRVAPNTGAARTGYISVSANIYTVRQDAGSTGACTVTPMNIGQTINGALTTADCRSPSHSFGDYWADQYSFTATAGQQIAILLTATQFDPYVYLKLPNGVAFEEEDGGGGGWNPRIPIDQGYLTIENSGTYIIEVTTHRSNDLGSYQLSLGEPFDECSYSISPATMHLDARSGSGSVNVTSPGLCSWTATSNAPSWLIITSGSSGAGSSTVNFLIAANTTSSPRTGTMTIAGQTFTVTQDGVTRLFDFTGDGRADVSIWEPQSGNWVLINSMTGETTLRATFGNASFGDVTVPADYDGDHQADVAVFRPGTGDWHIIQSTDGTTHSDHWGMPGDRAAPGDYDGDGKADLAVFRPSQGIWYILQSSTGTMRADQWGLSTDKVVPGDYDGDGKTDLAVYRPSQGIWYILQSSTGTMRADQWGMSTDKVVPGDYDGDGLTDLAVYRPSQGIWYIIQSTDRTMRTPQWGLSDDVPVAADYDGDGKSDIAVFRPVDGNWYIIQSTDRSFVVIHLGTSNDVPLPSSYVQ